MEVMTAIAIFLELSQGYTHIYVAFKVSDEEGIINTAKSGFFVNSKKRPELVHIT